MDAVVDLRRSTLWISRDLGEHMVFRGARQVWRTRESFGAL